MDIIIKEDEKDKLVDFFNNYLQELAEKSQKELKKNKAIKNIAYENDKPIVERGEYETKIENKSNKNEVIVEIVPEFNNIIDERSNAIHIDKAGFEGTRRILKLVNTIKRNKL
jgi:hypothetical protein